MASLTYHRLYNSNSSWYLESSPDTYRRYDPVQLLRMAQGLHTLEKPNLSGHDSKTDAHFAENQWREKMGLPIDPKYIKKGKVDKETVWSKLGIHTRSTEQESEALIQAFEESNSPLVKKKKL